MRHLSAGRGDVRRSQAGHHQLGAQGRLHPHLPHTSRRPGGNGETPEGEGRSQCSWLSQEPPAEGSGIWGSPSACLGVKSSQMRMGRSFRTLLNCSMAPTSTFGVLAVGAVGESLGCGGFDKSLGAWEPGPGASVDGHSRVLRLVGLGPAPTPGPSPLLLPAQCWGSARP